MEGLAFLGDIVSQIEQVNTLLNDSVSDGSLTITVGGQSYPVTLLPIDASVSCALGESTYGAICGTL